VFLYIVCMSDVVGLPKVPWGTFSKRPLRYSEFGAMAWRESGAGLPSRAPAARFGSRQARACLARRLTAFAQLAPRLTKTVDIARSRGIMKVMKSVARESCGPCRGRAPAVGSRGAVPGGKAPGARGEQEVR